jgi:CelD/BcsL family acetyltransferase involved in cellulose biosynthesis
MEFRHYNNFEDLTDHQPDWNSLLTKSAGCNPFLTFEYQQTWWKTRGGGEWSQDSELLIIAGFEDDRLVGIAPLFRSNNLEGKPALMFVGAIEVSDFLDFIVLSSHTAEFISGLLNFLTSEQNFPYWEILDLYNLLGDSPSLQVLKNEAERRGWTHQQTHLQPAPYISLPDNYDTYLASIDKKQRHEIRRKLRNIDQRFLESQLYIAEDPAKLDADIESFIAMMAQDPNKQAFLTPTMRQHIYNTAKIAFEQGWLHLAFLMLDGKKAAANLSFNFGGRLWLYNSGWEWDFRDYSPGWVLLAHLIKWSIENGLTEFDFMRGNENYKYKFGGVDRHIYRVTLSLGNS